MDSRHILRRQRSNNNETDSLNLPWDHVAAAKVESIRNDRNSRLKTRSFEDYCMFLSQFRPHLKELMDGNVFGIPFTLP